jgi:predicted nucleic acid-binding protein
MNDSGPPAFVDTNILVYAIAEDAGFRGSTAAALIHDLMLHGRLRTSTQVLQEAFVTLTRKIERRLTPQAALTYVDSIAKCPVLPVDFAMVRSAIELTMTTSISYWDALIVIAAERSGAKTLYTEDLQHNQQMLGVRIVNPFREHVAH